MLSLISSLDSKHSSFDVSVIIPTYNRILMLEEALKSIIAQQFDGTVEVIVVDDNSQDDTSETISKKYPFVHLISLKENVGPSAARNQAILKAKGKYIAFLDSDDLWEPNYLTTQIAALAGKERCFCVSALVTWDTGEDSKTILLQQPDLKIYTSSFHYLLVRGSFIRTPSSAVFPQQVFNEVGLFNETYRFGEDTDLYLRCLLSGYHPIFTDLPVAIRRIHGRGQATDSKNLELMEKSRIARADKYYSLIEKCVDIVTLSRIHAEIYAVFASYYMDKKYFLHWLSACISSAKKGFPRYTLFNMLRDINNLLSHHIPFLKLR